MGGGFGIEGLGVGEFGAFDREFGYVYADDGFNSVFVFIVGGGAAEDVSCICQQG